jgi:uroporphyrinogen-III synthase
MNTYAVQSLEKKERPLSGRRILLTRAGSDNDVLARELRKLGAVVLLLPCLQILPTIQPQLWQQQLQAVKHSDGIIFTSKYAVLAVQDNWPKHLLTSSYFAVGPTTAAQMVEAGLPKPVVAQPASSEGLLALPELQSIVDEQWLLIGGEDPRQYLQATLQSRQAHVNHTACYRRQCPSYSTGSLLRLEQEGINTLVIQSMDCLKNLALLLKNLPNHPLWACELLVPTERYRVAATERAFCGKLRVVGATTDDAIVATLLGRTNTKQGSGHG